MKQYVETNYDDFSQGSHCQYIKNAGGVGGKFTGIRCSI